VRQLAALHEVSHANKRLYRAFLLKEELRLLYHLDDPALAEAHLTAWLAWASRSKLKPFVKLARTLRARRDGILAAIRLGLSNGRMEGLNSKVRLLSHRSFGFHGPEPLIALIYLCCSRLTITPLEFPRFCGVLSTCGESAAVRMDSNAKDTACLPGAVPAGGAGVGPSGPLDPGRRRELGGVAADAA